MLFSFLEASPETVQVEDNDVTCSTACAVPKHQLLSLDMFATHLADLVAKLDAGLVLNLH